MKIVPLILSWTRSRIWGALSYQYAGLRVIDDIIDGDLPLELGTDIISYARKRFAIIARLGNAGYTPETDEDILLAEVLKQAKKYHVEEEMRESLQCIIRSLEFDAIRIEYFNRTQNLEFPTQESLQQHFFDLDIRGTGIGMLIYVGSRQIHEDLKKLHNIGAFCRIEYNLHDLIEDIGAGIVNISQEEAHTFGITPSDLQAIQKSPCIFPADKNDPAKIWQHEIKNYPEGIRKWIESQIKKFDEHYDFFIKNEIPKFPLFTRLVFFFFYMKEARRNINRIKNKFYSI